VLCFRVAAAFETAKSEGRNTFVGYVTTGYPTLDDTVPILLAMQKGGCDVIEMGVPFSDPLADGGTIQKANEVALENGVSYPSCLDTVRKARTAGLTVPVVFMGYYNPFLQYGEEEAAKAAKEAGADGFIVVDLPPESASSFRTKVFNQGLSFIPLVAPTTPDDRMNDIAKIASGFTYCVSLTGVTGSRNALPVDLEAFMARVRKYFKTPLAIGFGLSTRQHIENVGKIADGAVVGSAIIKTITAQPDTSSRAAAVEALIAQLVGRQ